MNMKLFECKYEGQTATVTGEDSVDGGDRGITITFNQSDNYLPEWTFSNKESLELLAKLQEWLNGSS